MPAAGRLGALALAGALVAVMLLLVNGPWLRISSVTWDGSRYVSGAAVAPILDPLKGTSLLLLDEASVAAELAQLPGVASATVEPRLPAGVAIELHERTPVIVWQTNAARLLVDESGTVFGRLALGGPLPEELRGLPLVVDRRVDSYGLRSGDRIPQVELATALQLRAVNPRLAGSSARSLSVAIDDRCGYLIGPAGGGWSAALGFHDADASGGTDPPTLDAQLGALRTLFSIHEERRIGWVDVRNPRKVYWRSSGSGSDTC
jgi:hypothetical protein